MVAHEPDAVQDTELPLVTEPLEAAPKEGVPIVTPPAVYPGQFPAVASVPLEVLEPVAVISLKCRGLVGWVKAVPLWK
jgi:hypothetical protein